YLAGRHYELFWNIVAGLDEHCWNGRFHLGRPESRERLFDLFEQLHRSSFPILEAALHGINSAPPQRGISRTSELLQWMLSAPKRRHRIAIMTKLRNLGLL